MKTAWNWTWVAAGCIALLSGCVTAAQDDEPPSAGAVESAAGMAMSAGRDSVGDVSSSSDPGAESGDALGGRPATDAPTEPMPVGGGLEETPMGDGGGDATDGEVPVGGAAVLDDEPDEPVPGGEDTAGEDDTVGGAMIEPDPSHCGDGQCDGDEDSASCADDCAMSIAPCADCGRCGHMDCWLWYSPSNARQAGGALPDFRQLFTEDSRWSESREMTGVFFMKMITLRQMLDDDFIEAHFVPKLLEWNMRLGFDVSGATWASCLDNREGRFNAEAEVIERIMAAGGRVEFLGLQSVLSKPVPDPIPASWGTNCPPLTMDQRFEDVLWYVEGMKSRFPGIKVGLIDALLAHGDDAAAIYGQLVGVLSAGGQAMDFVLFDHPYHYGETPGVTSWTSLRALELYVRDDLGLPTGLFHVSSRGGGESERRFYDEVLLSQDRYTEVGGRPEYHVVSSWFVQPQSELPEDAGADRYPLTKVLRDLGRRITEDNEAPVGVFGRISDDGVVHGWALDPDTPFVSVRISLYLDGPMGEGQHLGEFLADIPRPDVNTARELPGDHGFSVPIPGWPLGAGDHELYLYAHDTRDMGPATALQQSPQSFEGTP